MQNKIFYDLTNPQKTIWNMENFFQDTAINNICTPAIIYEKIDKEVLEKALNNVVKNNDNFRIQIDMQNGKPVQYIADFKPFKLDFININDESDLKVIENEEVLRKFDILNSCLFRFKVTVFKSGFFAVILTVNHLIADSWALGLVIKDILQEYHSIKNHKENTSIPHYSYTDYVESEEEYKKSEKYIRDKIYWEQLFKTIPEQAVIPSFKKTTKSISADAIRKSFVMDSKLVDKINHFCRENKLSVFNFLMSIYSIYISRVSGTDDFVLGTPILNRTNPKDKQTMGMFVNICPVRIKILEDSFLDFSRILSTNMLGILRHQKYSYSQILEDIREKNENISNLYNVLISYQITKAFDEEYGNYKTDWVFNNYCSADFNIHIADINDTGELVVDYDYLIDKYEEKDIDEIHFRIVNIINQILSKPEISVSNIEVITSKEKQKILYDFNNTALDFDKTKTIADLFEKQVNSHPNDIAVAFENQTLTYKELNERANSLAYYLRNTLNVKPNELVGIMVNRSIEIMVCILGIIKSGAAYVPIDPNYPKDRIKYMLENSKIKFLLTQKALENEIDFANKIFIDLEDNDLYLSNKQNLTIVNKPQDIAYVIFTSGSTGLPKGAILKHSNAINLKYAIEKFPGFSNNNSLASLATISFDMFVLESLVAALIGLKVVIASGDEQLNIKLFKSMCLKNNVDILQTTPSRIQSFMLSENDTEFIKNAKYILIGGEPFPSGLFDKLKSITSAKIFNMYGPTETTVWSSGKMLENSNDINIGMPLANTQIYILDKNLKPVPYGISGEIYISGDGVGKGYLNNETLTKNSFISNPFIPGSIMYKTGDLGLYNRNGDIVCLGRLDNQVKLRGLRIELGEIESKLNKLEDIESCAVVKKTDENSREFLCAYYTSKSTLNINDLKKYLGTVLPKYMVPAYFIQLDVMPYTTTGKIDRKNLPTPEFSKSDKQIVLPRNDIDSKLIEILRKLLKTDSISIDDSFFDIGGDSLSAINLCAEIQNEYGIVFFVKDILENPTIENLSDIISKSTQKSNKQIIKSAQKAEFYPVSSGQKRMYLLSQVSGNNSCLYNISGGLEFKENIDSKKLENCLNKLIARHESLRTYFELNGDTVVQKILDKVDFKLSFEENADFSKLDLIFKNFTKPFNLGVAPLFRAKLVKFTNGKNIVLIDMHHIISDGTSLSILSDELYKLYNDENLPELKITYKDFAAFENNRLSSGDLKQAEDYWLSKFDEIPVLDMPTNYPRPAVQSFKGKKVYSTICEEGFEKIEQLSKILGVTPYMILLSCYYILLSKYSSSEDIVVGSPVVGRDIAETYNLIGMFVNTLALRNKPDSNLSFKDFLFNVKNNLLDSYKYQTYPFDELINKLNIKRDTSRNPLFDIMFIYQNNIYKDEFYMPDTGIAKFDLSLEAVQKHDSIDLSFEYATDLFDEEFIQNLSKHYINILKSVIDNIDIKISNINMLSKTEENTILNEFNNTYSDYPKNKTISELFEKQVEKTPNNIALVFENQELTYKELNEKANSLAYYLRNTKQIKPNNLVGIMVNRSLEMIISILAVLKAGGAYIPIDPMYPEDRINYMLENSKAKILLTQEHLKDKVAFENSVYVDLKNLKLYSLDNKNLENVNTPEDLSYVIFTSGSTGLPKGVMLKHKALSNLTNYCNNYIEYLKNPIYKSVVSITTISFDIFIFETLISLQKGLKLIIANENEQTSASALNSLIEKYDIKIIQSTPSRMQVFLDNKNLMPCIKNLEYVILAGEQLPLRLVNTLYSLSNVVIYNGYGPSETTVFSTLTKMGNDSITIGKPLDNTQIYILDNNLNLLPIGVPGEIYISGDGVGKGYLNNETLTKKSFIPNPFIPGSIMYKTGDLGLYNPDGNITCLGRVDNQVKLRGLRIELGEIEEKINSLPFINSCVVVKKIDETSREYLCAYFTSSENVDSSLIRKKLEAFLPLYMIPGYFMQLDVMPYTPNGKIDRKALPNPQFETKRSKIIMPRNNIESRLVEIIKKILNIDTISIDDSFFDLGGDSLSAINLCAKLQNEFSVEFYVKDILEHPIIENLSNIISNVSELSYKKTIPHLEKADFYQVSSAQKRMYFSTQMAGKSSVIYNISGGIEFKEDIDSKKLENCITKLINRHEALRTYFELNGDTVVQKILDKVDFKLSFEENADFSKLDLIFKNFTKPFNLGVAPLFRAKLVKFTNGKNIVLIDMHHIISDGTSLSILSDELYKLYNDENLPELKITYKDFAAFENNRLSSGDLKQAEDYWLSKFDEIPVLDMPTNYPRPAVQSFKGKKVYSTICEEGFEKIEQLSKILGVTPYMILLSCYYILLSKYSSSEDIVVGSPVVGRDIAETYNLIGMFVNTLALRNKPDSNLSFKDFLFNVKNNLLDSYKYQTYPFDELINKLNIKRDTSRNPLFDIMFIYQNNIYKDEFYMPDTGIAKFDLSLEAVQKHDSIDLSFEYATDLFDEEFIQNLSKHYINILKSVIDNIDIKISNINMLSKTEENTILNEFNNTYSDYPKNKTISELFEKQVEKTPNNIALVFENQELTYKELNEKANSLAYYLRNTKQIKPNNLVGIMVNRSLEMIISILAVLKAGGAYIPIDPMYPEDRINYMLENSKAKILLTQEHLKDKVAFDGQIFVDLNNTNIYDLSYQNLEVINTPEDLAYVIFTSGSTGLPKGVMLKQYNIINFIYGMLKNFNFMQDETMVSITTISFDIFVLESLMPLLNGQKVVIANEEDQINVNLFNDLCVKNNVKIIQTTPSRIQTFIANASDLSFIKNATHILIGGEPFPDNLLKDLKNITTAQIFNMYGPTETAVWSSLENLSKSDLITIGKPISNTQIYILDKNLKPLPVGVPGELYISGDGVGKGYLNNETQTKNCFINNPFIPNTLMYKTGDNGMYTKHGKIICLGRSDNQVKLRGLRIELQEIEKRILEYPHIKKVAVIKQTLTNREFISAYFVADKRIVINELRNFLYKFLPRYMVPSYYIALDSLPYTPNGKIDRKALPLSQEILQISKEEYVKPQTKLQKKLVQIWEKILNTKPIGINDNFFELGGDSILAMNLNIELLKISNKISYADIFRFPTISELEERINSSNEDLFFDKIENLSEGYEDILKKCTKTRIIKSWNPKGILLTGSTGFLGIHVLEQFIKNGDQNIYCIVREEPGLTSRAKLYQKLLYYFGDKYTSLLDKRIFAVTGDITLSGFGLNQEALLNLSNSIDVVINCAANVSHFGNYKNFYNSNVKSVNGIIDFCRSFDKKLYHISTISVASRTLDTSYLAYKKKRWRNKNYQVSFDESSLYIGQILDNVYSRSKFEAECSILDGINKGLDGYILRVGNLMPRFRDGVFQENISSNAFISRVLAFIKMGAIPEYLINEHLELTPVDITAKAIYKLVTHYTKENRIFHLYNHHAVPIKKVLKLLDKDIVVLNDADFKAKLKSVLEDDDSKDILKNLMNFIDESLHIHYENDIITKSNFTIKYLFKTYFWWPKISNKYLKRFIKLLRKVI